MERFGISVQIRNVPKLDPDFIPILQFNRAFLKTAKKPVAIAVERADGQVAAARTFIHGTPEMAEADRYYIDRLVKTALWMQGGFRIYVDDKDLYGYLSSIYRKGGDLLLESCRRVLEDEYPDCAAAIRLTLPDEKFRRVGQSMAAASLPLLFSREK